MLISKKMQYIEKNIRKMVEPLKSDQKLLRYMLNLNDYPQELQYFDEQGNTISQPDFNIPYDLIITKENGNDGQIHPLSLLMFNPTIATQKQVHIFFYHLKSKFRDEKNAIGESIYRIDITIPSEFLYIENEGALRQEQICNLILSHLDQQKIAGVGYVFCEEVSEFIDNQTYGYQGLSIILKVKDISKTSNKLFN